MSEKKRKPRCITENVLPAVFDHYMMIHLALPFQTGSFFLRTPTVALYSRQKSSFVFIIIVCVLNVMFTIQYLTLSSKSLL